jgi:hypothetical protein
MTGRCCLCGAVGSVERHHVTGRLVRGGDYVDPALVIELCVPCHTGRAGIHPALRAAGLNFPQPGVDLLVFRGRKSGATDRLIGAAGGVLTLGPAAAIAEGDLICQLADAVADERGARARARGAA